MRGGVDRRADLQRTSARSRQVFRHNELLERTSALTGLRVHSVDVGNREHVAHFPGLARAGEGNGNAGSALGADGRTDSDRSTPVTRGVVNDRLRHIDLVIAKHALTHHAGLELAADRVNGVEKALHAFYQVSVGGRVDGGVAGSHAGSRFVQLLLTLEQYQRGRRGSARRTNRGIDALVSVSNVCVDRGSKLAYARLQYTLCEVIQLHGEFCGGEVDADVLLVSNRQRGELLVVVLNLQGGTVSYQSAVWKTDTERRTDFSAFNGERIVVLAVYVAGDHQVVLQDLEGLTGDHVYSKQ